MDWPAVREVASWLDIDVRTPRILRGLRILESITLEHHQKKAAAETKPAAPHPQTTQ